MKNLKKLNKLNNSGFGHLSIIALCLVIIAIGFVGLNVYKSNNDKINLANSSKPVSPTNILPTTSNPNIVNKTPISSSSPTSSSTSATTTTRILAPTPAATSTSTPNLIPVNSPKVVGYQLNYLLNSGAPNINIPTNTNVFTMTCYKGGGSGGQNNYSIVAQTLGGNVVVNMCYYQDFEATLNPAGTYATLHLANNQNVTLSTTGAAPFNWFNNQLTNPVVQLKCPAPLYDNGPIIPMDVSNGAGKGFAVQLCPGFLFTTTPVYQ